MSQILVENRRARYDYQIDQTVSAGVVLTGGEVKSLRAKQASLGGAFVQIMGDLRPVLLGATITPYPYADNRDYDPKRTRTLLLRKKELYQLQAATQQKGYTLIPLAFVADEHNFIKLQIGVARGKKQFEKRDQIKKRDLAREERYNY